MTRGAVLVLVVIAACGTKGGGAAGSGSAAVAGSGSGVSSGSGAALANERCQQLPFAGSTPVPEASGAAWLTIGGKPVLAVVSDSGNHGAYGILDPDSGDTLETGRLPLGATAGQDLEGAAVWDDQLVTINGSTTVALGAVLVVVLLVVVVFAGALVAAFCPAAGRLSWDDADLGDFWAVMWQPQDDMETKMIGANDVAHLWLARERKDCLARWWGEHLGCSPCGRLAGRDRRHRLAGPGGAAVALAQTSAGLYQSACAAACHGQPAGADEARGDLALAALPRCPCHGNAASRSAHAGARHAASRASRRSSTSR